jgi:very-short-patch-repair endonuclease
VATVPPARQRPPAKPLCGKTPNLAPGIAFVSECAPRPASAAEAMLRHKLTEALTFVPGLTGVKTRQPFFAHLEVWPDIIIDELRVAIEYDTTGRDGLEHVGRRETADKRKDSLLRQNGWEVVRVRMGTLQRIGAFDIEASTLSNPLVSRLLDGLRDIRGALIVDCYLR